jgi:hypothetical protein
MQPTLGRRRLGSPGRLALTFGCLLLAATAAAPLPAAAAEPPSATLAPYEPSSATTVRLVGFVNPRGAQTTYRFEYGPGSCATTACLSLPVAGEAAVGGGTDAVRVREEVGGLQPASTYRFRLVASNEGGSAISEEGTFSTLAKPVESSCPNEDLRWQQRAGFLPDCRAYERVSALSPAARNGSDVLVDSQHARSAVDGTAFQFSSTTAAAGSQALPVSTDYMALRRPGVGWSVHGITPPQRGMSLSELVEGRQPRYVGEFSPDLSRAVFLSNSLLSAEGQGIGDVLNLYLREDLLAMPGSYRLLSDTFAPVQAEPFDTPVLAGTSDDFSHVLFESTLNLTPEAVGVNAGVRLYEWVDGEVRMAGILPGDEGGGPTVAKAGRGAGEKYTSSTISRDGSRIVFATPPFAESGAGGALYLRDDHGTGDPFDDTTVEVSRSEREVADPSGPQPVSFWGASSDLSQVFFATAESLTDDASLGGPGATKLYRFSPEAPPGERLALLSVDRNPDDGITDQADGIVGASAEGSYVYFVSSNQLVPGGPIAPTPRIFLWHEGEIREVAPVNAQTELGHLLGNEWRASAQWARVTPDGTHLTFLSEGGGEPGGFDHGEDCPGLSTTRCLQVYVYSAAAEPGRLQCASCSQDGSRPAADADFNVRSNVLVMQGDQHLNRALTDDGRYVFFTTAQGLAPADLNDLEDVYRFDGATGLIAPLTPGQPGVESYFLEASTSGDDSFVATRSALVSTDRDGNFDVYDVRAGGGFADGGEETPACASEASCRPPESAGSDLALPASATLVGPGHKRRLRRHCHRRGHRRYCHRHRHGKRTPGQARRHGDPSRAAGHRG